MAVYPAHPYRRVVYTEGNTECVETRCPNCRKAVFWIVRTTIEDTGLVWTLRMNDRECECDLSDADTRWLESVAMEAHPNDTEDEEWWCLYREMHPDHDGAVKA